MSTFTCVYEVPYVCACFLGRGREERQGSCCCSFCRRLQEMVDMFYDMKACVTCLDLLCTYILWYSMSKNSGTFSRAISYHNKRNFSASMIWPCGDLCSKDALSSALFLPGPIRSLCYHLDLILEVRCLSLCICTGILLSGSEGISKRASNCTSWSNSELHCSPHYCSCCRTKKSHLSEAEAYY